MFALTGNWVYAYADFGRGGDTCSTSGPGCEIVQDGALFSMFDELGRVLIGLDRITSQSCSKCEDVAYSS